MTYHLCEIIDGLPVSVSEHDTREDAEDACLAAGEEFPCGGDKHIIIHLEGFREALGPYPNEREARHEAMRLAEHIERGCFGGKAR